MTGIHEDDSNMIEGTAMRKCFCGSGLPRFEIRDAAGIFCTFACDSCEREKRAGYNPAIFEDRTYSATGEEEDLPWPTI